MIKESFVSYVKPRSNQRDNEFVSTNKWKMNMIRKTAIFVGMKLGKG